MHYHAIITAIVERQERVRTTKYAPQNNAKGWRIYLSSISGDPRKGPETLIFESMFWMLKSGEMKYVYMISNFDALLINFNETTVTAGNWDDIWSNIALVDMPSGIFRTAAEPNDALGAFLKNVAIDHSIVLPRIPVS